MSQSVAATRNAEATEASAADATAWPTQVEHVA